MLWNLLCYIWHSYGIYQSPSEVKIMTPSDQSIPQRSSIIPELGRERMVLLFFLLWSLWLGAEHWIMGPLSYLRIHDTATSWMPSVLSWNTWADQWGDKTMGWLCTVDRMSNIGWWWNFTLPFLFLPPWLAMGILITLQRLVASYFTYRLLRDHMEGSLPISVAAGCVFSLLNTDLGEVCFMHGLSEPGVPLLLWFFWRLPLDRPGPILGWSLAMGILVGWSMSFFAGTLFVVPVVWLALQIGREDLTNLRSRLWLTLALALFATVSLLCQIPPLWALTLAAPESHRGLNFATEAINWPHLLQVRIRHLLSWWPFYLGAIWWIWKSNLRQGNDRVVGIFLLMGLVVSPIMGPVRHWLSPWIGFLRGVEFQRFWIVAPAAFTMALFCALDRGPRWIGRLSDSQGRLRLQLPLSGILATLILGIAGWNSCETKYAHWRLQRYEGYNWRALFGNDDVAEYVRKSQWEGSRMATAGAHTTLNPGYLLAYGADTADGHAALYGIRYHRFWAQVIAPLMNRDPDVRGFHNWGAHVYLHHARSGEDYFVREIPFHDWYRLDLLSLAGVRYFVSDKRISDGRLELMPMPRYENRMASWNTLSVAEKIRRYATGENPGRRLYVYRNPSAMPRFFLVPSIRTFPNANSLWQAMGEATTDNFRAAVFVTTNDMPAQFDLPGDFEGEPTVAVLSQNRESRKLAISLPQPGILVITDQYYPWWRWTVNGQDASAFPAYGVFMGLPLPAGESIIEGYYRPPYLRLLNFGSRTP